MPIRQVEDVGLRVSGGGRVGVVHQTLDRPQRLRGIAHAERMATYKWTDTLSYYYSLY